MPNLLPKQIEELPHDIVLRRAAAKTLKGFCFTYLNHHFTAEPSDFFDEMSEALEDYDIKRLEVIGFRGCAKSTMASLALVLWCALEHPELYPFIIMLADTQSQASINAASVQHELRDNELILKDYGHLKYKRVEDPNPEPTLESDDDWQALNCVLDNGVRVLARSRGQKIRGLKHRQHRPSMIVADDVEDLDWVRSQENRDKSDRWMRGNVLPSIEERNGRMIIIGNWLHMDGLMARLKATKLFKVLEFPLLRDGPGTDIERCTWKAKYPTQEAIDRKHDELGEIGFRREMLLQVVPEEGQDVHIEDIHYWDEPPFDDGNHMAHGVDLAISTKESADYTAIVSAEVAEVKGGVTLFVQPHPVIERMNFTDTIARMEHVRKNVQLGMHSEFFVEAVAYQQVAIEELERRGFDVMPMHPMKDKRARLRVAARYIKNGSVLFPRKGAERLITQLLGFGIEKHDDAVDALVYLILGVSGESMADANIHFIDRTI